LARLSAALTTGSTAYPQWGLSWTYDRYANRTQQKITAGTGVPSNLITVSPTTNQITGSPYLYDLSGNMTNDGLNTLAYDGENRATSATNSGSSGAYVYDGGGLRVKKVAGSTTTVYIFSDTKVVAEYDNGAAPTAPSREYVYSGTTLIAKFDSTGTHYYHRDTLSNRLVTDSSGNVSAQLGHYPYGESWYNASNDKLLFTSYERDSESGNDYAQARYYVSRLGRFSSTDPLTGSTSDPQSLNRYVYGRDLPVVLVDPSGQNGGCPDMSLRKQLRQWDEYAGTGHYLPSEMGEMPAPQDGWDYCGGGGSGGDDSSPELPLLTPCVTALAVICIEVIENTGTAPGQNSSNPPLPDIPDLGYGGLPPVAGGGGGGGIPLTPQNIKKLFYLLYGKMLNDCIQNVFGADAANVPQQTLQNSPNLDTRLSEAQLSKAFGFPNVVGENNPHLGPNGTVYIASNKFHANGPNELNFIFGTFAHETGNILDETLNPPGTTGGQIYGKTYGDLNDDYDTDTGAQIEECIFGALQGINGPYP
jgi:RHS repeat-associated protein